MHYLLSDVLEKRKEGVVYRGNKEHTKEVFSEQRADGESDECRLEKL